MGEVRTMASRSRGCAPAPHPAGRNSLELPSQTPGPDSTQRLYPATMSAQSRPAKCYDLTVVNRPGTERWARVVMETGYENAAGKKGIVGMTGPVPGESGRNMRLCAS